MKAKCNTITRWCSHVSYQRHRPLETKAATFKTISEHVSSFQQQNQKDPLTTVLNLIIAIEAEIHAKYKDLWLFF